MIQNIVSFFVLTVRSLWEQKGWQKGGMQDKGL